MNSRILLSAFLSLVFVVAFFLALNSISVSPRNDGSAAEQLIGLSFSSAERDSMTESLNEQKEQYSRIRAVPMDNSVMPAVLFNPIPAGFVFEKTKKPFTVPTAAGIRFPSDTNELAFLTIPQLAELIRTKKISSVQLTQFFIDRLKKYGPKLECVISLTDSIAFVQAQRADEEIARGKYRGILHGIPYGVKDLLAVKGTRTTWGSVPFKEQKIDLNATVASRLETAGAVLLAKLTMGELAWGDVWFGGTTRNPWNYDQGSSGSSAGSASATAAGLVPFAIGTETYGSIASPSARCGTTGLRPTYGRISRHGAMALSWSMDKIGPICRSVEDCAIVFNTIQGPDGIDPTLYDAPFNYSSSVDLSKIRIGYLKNEFDSLKEDRQNADSVLTVLRSLGANLLPLQLPQRYPVNDLGIILSAEAGAAFDELTRSGKDDLMVRQIKNAWPNVFRASRFIPAVEYIQANRIRTLLIQDMAAMMEKIDVYIAPPFEGDNLLLTNLTGHPSVVLPNGFSKEGTPTSITFVGRLFGEAELLAVAKKYQDATDHHKRHPRLK